MKYFETLDEDDKVRIVDQFNPNQLNNAGIGLAELVTERFVELASAVIKLTPKSREQSLAITNLEQAKMWAIKAIAMNQGN